MVIPIPSQYQRFAIKLRVVVFYPMRISIVVYDPTHTHTHYFRRKLSFRDTHFKTAQAVRDISIALPVSPRQLSLRIADKYSGKDDGFEITDFRLVPMPHQPLWASEARHRFMDFAIAFAQKAGYSPTGFYNSPDNEFLIQYLPTITSTDGTELVTPARIHQRMPRVQLSKQQFKSFSIPVRVAILSHEGCHFFKNTRSEREADLCGIRYYLDYGFPTIEAVYATTKVFLQHPESVGKPHLTRTRDIIAFIDHYKAQKQQEIL